MKLKDLYALGEEIETFKWETERQLVVFKKRIMEFHFDTERRDSNKGEQTVR